MSSDSEHDRKIELIWHTYLTTGKVPPGVKQLWFESDRVRPFAKLLPHSPRCRICHYHFAGLGGFISRIFLHLEPSKLNPQMCNVCERFARQHKGGAEVEIGMVFADVRGSTTMAEGVRPAEYSKRINRFYHAATDVIFKHDGWVEKLLGDEVVGFFVPGYTDGKHALASVEAGKHILQATGHASPSGPWIPVGVGVHTGLAFVGSVNASGGGADVSILGDAVNTAARIATQAAAGELLISDATLQKAGITSDGMQRRDLELKGKSTPVRTWAWKS
jgi:adenylate cyclase